MMMIVFPVLFLTLLSPSEACFKPPPVCPNDKQSCIADNNDNVLQIKEVSNPLKCSKLAKLSLSVLLNQRVPSIAILGVILVIAILGVLLVLLLREQITIFWRVYHLCTYKRCRKNAMSHFLLHFFAT